MLAPSLVDCESDIASVWSVILKIGGFCESCLNADIAQVDPPLAWVPEVQQILASCREMAQKWLVSRQTVIGSVASAFSGYSSLITAAAQALGSSQDAMLWSKTLGVLRAATSGHSDALRQVAADLASQQSNFQTASDRLDGALALAHQQMSAEEADIAALEVKLQSLFDRLQSLGASISSNDMATEQKVVSTVVSITYEIAVAGETAIPYLSVASVLFSIGNSVYTLVSTDEQIAALLDEVTVDMRQLSADARLLAMTRVLVSCISSLLHAYTAAMQWAPRLNSYWDAETGKIDELLEALRQGSTSGLTDLASLGVAETIWQQLAKTANAMVAPLQKNDDPVPLSISVP